MSNPYGNDTEFTIREDGTVGTYQQVSNEKWKARNEDMLKRNPELAKAVEKLKKHPYIKAIQRFCQPPWYVRLWRKVFRSS